jgi:hypothetical protein
LIFRTAISELGSFSLLKRLMWSTEREGILVWLLLSS